MEDNLYDKVVDILHQRQSLVAGELGKRFGKVKPFRSEPVDNKEMLVYYDQMMNDVNGKTYLDTLVQRHGRETVNIFIQEMEQKKNKYSQNKGV